MSWGLRWALAVVLAIAGCEDDPGDGERGEPGRQVEPVPAKPDEAEQPQAAPEPDEGPAAEPLDPEAIGEALGAEVTTTPGGVVRASWMRDEVPVEVDGMPFPPAQGLGSWAAFTRHEDGAMVMGDTVVFEDEVDAAMDAALDNHLAVTALHNHFFYDEPKVYFMHVGGVGDPVELATSLKAVWAAIRSVRAEHPTPRTRFGGDPVEPGGDIDIEALERIIGHGAERKPGDVVKVTVGRAATMGGTEVGKAMGVATWAAFSGSDGHAAMDGDFAMAATEVADVLKALRAHDVHVVALHNHMINEQPTLYFLHFWAKGPVPKLAKGFRAALDAQRQSE